MTPNHHHSMNNINKVAFLDCYLYAFASWSRWGRQTFGRARVWTASPLKLSSGQTTRRWAYAWPTPYWSGRTSPPSSSQPLVSSMLTPTPSTAPAGSTLRTSAFAFRYVADMLASLQSLCSFWLCRWWKCCERRELLYHLGRLEHLRCCRCVPLINVLYIHSISICIYILIYINIYINIFTHLILCM